MEKETEEYPRGIRLRENLKRFVQLSGVPNLYIKIIKVKLLLEAMNLRDGIYFEIETGWFEDILDTI